MAISRSNQTKQMKCGGKTKAKKMKKGGIIRGCKNTRRGKKYTRAN